MNEIDDTIIEIQDSFLVEAADMLSEVEALSLGIEKDPTNELIFEQLARLAHNLKGSGKAVGFDHVSKFAHKIEDYVLAIRHKKVAPVPENLDLLFRCLDQLKSDIKELQQDRVAVLDHTTIIESLKNAELSQTTDSLSEKVSHSLDSFISDSILPKSVDQEPMPALRLVKKSSNHETAKNSAAQPEQKKNSVQTEVLRIPKAKIDLLLESFGEQVILQSMLEQSKFCLNDDPDAIIRTISQLTKLTFELQNYALSLTMIQLTSTFTKLERAVRDAARQCNKEVKITLIGEETEASKPLVDALSDSLVHMVRNGVDHALEEKEERKLKGKNEIGTITIKAERSGSQLCITISDDGKGLDAEMLKRKAVSKGIISEVVASGLTNEEAYQLIFANGFSTKEIVSELSGRGVGMNVVKETVSSLNGSIEIQSEIDKGTTFTLSLPLTLAIFNGAIVKVNGSRFVVPNSEISEICRVNPDLQTSLDHKNSAIKIRDEIFQFIDLRRLLGFTNQTHERVKSKKNEYPVLVSRKLGNKAFLVDEIMGMQKIVQKQVGAEILSQQSFVAGTILSDGTPGVVLNLQQLAQVS